MIKPSMKKYRKDRDPYRPFTLIVLRGHEHTENGRTLRIILDAVNGFRTKAEAEAARQRVREDLRPICDIAQFGGYA